MQRTQSRQRLVSWDAFDATADFQPENIYCTAPMKDSGGKRKRYNNTHLIPKDNDVDENTSSSITYSDLPDVVKICLAGYLTRPELAKLALVSRQHHRLLHTPDALQQVWMPLYKSIWEFLDSSSFTTDLKYPQVVDLAARKPATIDKTLVRKDIKVTDTIEFTGTVGLGDRCIRADKSLPTPKLHKRKFLARLRYPKYYHEPFVAPFRNRDGSWNLQKRLISYFEVSILPQRKKAVASPHTNNSTTPECVAVGLATAAFNISSRMPGWDSQSFGFHGDDGGIFHNAGSMRKLFGRSFGGSDVIGCGIDYDTHQIFYTRNGDFLGYAFELKEHQLASAYFPVIGMDTNCPIVCNFGQTPFLFDLKKMIDTAVHSCEPRKHCL